MRLREVILAKRNKAVTPESITNWFRRHPDVRKELEKEVIAEELPKEEVSETIFQNGTFEELNTVKTWIRDMRRRACSEGTIKDWTGGLKRICQGIVAKRGIDLADHEWAYKHPDRLTLEDCMHFIDLLGDHYPDVDTSSHRRVMRNFLKSKGIVVGSKIPPLESKGAGQMSKLFVARETLGKILAWINALNYEAYVCDHFMFKTAGRINATLDARLENITIDGDRVELTIYDKAKRRKYPQGMPCDKRIPPELFKELCDLSGYPERKSGTIFNITEDEMAKINRAALEEFCPELFKRFPNLMVTHFWRHMFFQHMLRKTGWNYAATAAVGHCSVSSLERNYGKPDKVKVREWGSQHVADL